MLRVVHSQGSVVIDIQNLAKNQINNIYKIHKFENETSIGKLYKTFNNIAKVILRKGTQVWPFIVSQTPSDPKHIMEVINKYKLTSVQVYGFDFSSKGLVVSDENCKINPRLVFVIQK